MTQLSEQQYAELTSGGPTEMHHHPRRFTRDDIDQFQAEYRIREVSTNYTAALDDDIIVVNTSAGNVTVTLPTVRNQKEYILTKASALNTLTVAFTAGATCFGQATVGIVTLGDRRRFKAFLSNWITI